MLPCCVPDGAGGLALPDGEVPFSRLPGTGLPARASDGTRVKMFAAPRWLDSFLHEPLDNGRIGQGASPPASPAHSLPHPV